MNTVQKKLHLITYGLGDEYSLANFRKVRNRKFGALKPIGGLWSSPVDSEWGWRDWCEAEKLGDLETSFTFEFTGNVLMVDSETDAASMSWYVGWDTALDFEAMAEAGVDAIYLTERGQYATRFGEPSLYGWDCECVLIINPEGILCSN